MIDPVENRKVAERDSQKQRIRTRPMRDRIQRRFQRGSNIYVGANACSIS